ncbi:hypothetical protein FPE01S_01_16050 [Flavihumibacter petaseus NBRC 106054]|uniref:Uncharacterized protein n=2 Tax=Flavihumibacter TaxID=1004301 RepID=A0A0E9MZP0_9BACT|nr:hypothetical protein FPE01S_01_16050 [Flavihumibacter petaseus NBRC 106054]
MKLYYQFTKGDRIIYHFEETNGKTLKEVEISENADITRFLEYDSKELDKVLDVSRKVIFHFRFRNTTGGKRTCHLQIGRVPSSAATTDFVTAVEPWMLGDTTNHAKNNALLLQKTRKKILLMSPTNYVLSSTSNSVLKGWKSKIAVPIELPLHTVEWYYRFSVGSANDSTFSGTSFTGGETCDIYLIDKQNLTSFETDPAFPFYESGIQVDAHEGLVKMEPFQKHQLLIGLINPNNIKGITVRLEVVAFVEESAGTQ